ncbi:MAG: hypothetical protein M0036_12300 [Desulfobacteraceae bacterium]|nr:hypothetical protein [Desulfobacteraceae bacterium]
MSETFTIVYEFTLADKGREQFELVFDAASIELVKPTGIKPPHWTKLTYEQCPHCPLTPRSHPHCPVALNLVPVINHFDQLMSFDKITVQVTSSERQVVQNTSAQEGLSSLMGLLIAGSSCPYTHFFKPMARFHLPFASKDETLWRAAATFLLSCYFTHQGLKLDDMRLGGLVSIYDDVAKLNDAMVQRLRAASSKDSAVNALVHLDVFAKFLMPPLDDSLAQIKSIFEPYISTLRS